MIIVNIIISIVTILMITCRGLKLVLKRFFMIIIIIIITITIMILMMTCRGLMVLLIMLKLALLASNL